MLICLGLWGGALGHRWRGDNYTLYELSDFSPLKQFVDGDGVVKGKYYTYEES
jgi:hypothetical protein